MKYIVQTAKSFEKELKRLSKRYASMADDYERLLDELEQNPLLGTSLGGGIPYRLERQGETRWSAGHYVYGGGYSP